MSQGQQTVKDIPLRILFEDVIVNLVQERYNRVDGERALNNVRMKLIQAELTISVQVVRMVCRRFVLLVLHEEQVPEK